MADDLEKKFNAALKLMDEGKCPEAFTKFKKLCEEYPDNPEVWYFKAESGNMASGMFGKNIKNEDIIEAYNKARDLDSENADYHQSYGLFCISIGKYEDAEDAYKAAAECDESRESMFYSEFAIEYYNNIMAQYGEILENDPKAGYKYTKKALEYMLKALDITPEMAKEIL